MTHYHFIGVCGAGMSAIAGYLLARGNSVSGSDRSHSTESDRLSTLGLQFHAPQSLKTVEQLAPTHLIRSAAVPETNVECTYHAAKHYRRGAFLAELCNAHGKSIAICGTHGKGTTSGYLVSILSQRKQSYSYILGAKLKRDATNYRYEDEGELVVEVDESDRTHRLHRPHLLIINNLEADHLNEYGTLEALVDDFATLARNTIAAKGHVILHIDGDGATQLDEKLADLTAADGLMRLCWQGQNPRANFIARKNTKFTIEIIEATSSQSLFAIQTQLPGIANQKNAAMAALCAHQLGVARATIEAGILAFEGMYDRLECHHGTAGTEVYTDYASHPTCIDNDLRALRRPDRRILAIFHPYRPSLMRYHWRRLISALSLADEVILLPLDLCGETPITGINAPEMARQITETGTLASVRSIEAIEEYLSKIATKSMTIVVFAGGYLFQRIKQATGCR